MILEPRDWSLLLTLSLGKAIRFIINIAKGLGTAVSLNSGGGQINFRSFFRPLKQIPLHPHKTKQNKTSLIPGEFFWSVR